MSTTNFKGKVALISGGSQGIGRSTAIKLAQQGASVAIVYSSNDEAANETLKEIQAQGVQGLAIKADWSKVDAIRKVFQEVISKLGHLDIFINNAAITVEKKFSEITEEDFDRVINLNTKGAFFALQEAAKVITDGGRIIAISSGGTKMGIQIGSVYWGSKAATEQFVKSLAHELAPRNITVNTVSPGFTDTKMLGASDFKNVAASMSPFKRVADPDEVADVIVFVASHQARWITGDNIQASGGVVMT